MRLVARHPPRFSRETEERNAGDPLAQSRKQGPIFFCILAPSPRPLLYGGQMRWHDLQYKWKTRVRRAHQLSLCERGGLWWARRTPGFPLLSSRASAFAHPTSWVPACAGTNRGGALAKRNQSATI